MKWQVTLLSSVLVAPVSLLRVRERHSIRRSSNGCTQRHCSASFSKSTFGPAGCGGGFYLVIQRKGSSPSRWFLGNRFSPIEWAGHSRGVVSCLNRSKVLQSFFEEAAFGSWTWRTA